LHLLVKESTAGAAGMKRLHFGGQLKLTV